MAHKHARGHCKPHLIKITSDQSLIDQILQSAHDVLASLPTLQTPLLTSNSVPLLLVTPKLAHWLDASDGFLPQLMQNLYGKAPKTDCLYAVAAVVDKIPCKPKVVGGLDKPSAAETISESEGLSLLLVGEHNVQGKPVPPRKFGGPADEETDLLFSIQNGEGKQSPTDGPHRVGLRLANTVFVNGKESTLFGMRWKFDTAENTYTRDHTIDLTSCTVTSSHFSSKTEPRVTLPLHPLGQRKRVLASMGNILRQISKSTDPASNDPIPASSDLEKDLPQYIKEHNISDHRVSVWALVEKPQARVTDSNLSAQEYLNQSLRQGGKLHRVVSGGGGWGKKQGLLSLDPEICFSGSANPDALAGLEMIFNPSGRADLDSAALVKSLVGDDLSLLSQVATAGDFIQFFVSTDPSEPHERDAQSVGSNVTFNFGMVSRVEGSHSVDYTSGQGSLEFVPNTFGALSEKAIAYNQPVAVAGGSSESSTKLDIPGCRVSFGW